MITVINVFIFAFAVLTTTTSKNTRWCYYFCKNEWNMALNEPAVIETNECSSFLCGSNICKSHDPVHNKLSECTKGFPNKTIEECGNKTNMGTICFPCRSDFCELKNISRIKDTIHIPTRVSLCYFTRKGSKIKIVSCPYPRVVEYACTSSKQFTSETSFFVRKSCVSMSDRGKWIECDFINRKGGYCYYCYKDLCNKNNDTKGNLPVLSGKSIGETDVDTTLYQRTLIILYLIFCICHYYIFSYS